jgi:hypothetical protein
MAYILGPASAARTGGGRRRGETADEETTGDEGERGDADPIL